MSRDLDEQLEELGPAYREVVDRLRAAYEPSLSRKTAGGWRSIGWAAGFLAAASVLVVLGLSVFFVEVHPPREYTLAFAGGDAGARALIATQNADGSWANDFQTRQNAAALRGNPATVEEYKRAVRYLKAKGLSPLTDGELQKRAAQMSSFNIQT